MTSDPGGLSASSHFVLNLGMAAGPGHLGRMTLSPQRTPFLLLLLPHATQLNWSVLAAGSLSLEQAIAHTDGDTVTTPRGARYGCHLLQSCQQPGPRPLVEITTHGRWILQMPPMTLSHAGTRTTVTLSNFLMQLPAAVCGWGLLPCPSARTEKRMIVPERVSTNGPLTSQWEQNAVFPTRSSKFYCTRLRVPS